MKCPNCKHNRSSIAHSYHVLNHRGVKRERVCKRCFRHWMTMEKPIIDKPVTPPRYDNVWADGMDVLAWDEVASEVLEQRYELWQKLKNV